MKKTKISVEKTSLQKIDMMRLYMLISLSLNFVLLLGLFLYLYSPVFDYIAIVKSGTRMCMTYGEFSSDIKTWCSILLR